ncbi:MAG: hypothetical protein LBJ03_00120 [Holosporales bacterium]|nr:hypothetical protein [Holosporales bacterium]
MLALACSVVSFTADASRTECFLASLNVPPKQARSFKIINHKESLFRVLATTSNLKMPPESEWDKKYSKLINHLQKNAHAACDGETGESLIARGLQRGNEAHSQCTYLDPISGVAIFSIEKISDPVRNRNHHEWWDIAWKLHHRSIYCFFVRTLANGTKTYGVTTANTSKLVTVQKEDGALQHMATLHPLPE